MVHFDRTIAEVRPKIFVIKLSFTLTALYGVASITKPSGPNDLALTDKT